MIDLLMLAVLGFVTWRVADEGAWGAAMQFLCVLWSALLTMNYFEPLAAILEGLAPAVRPYADTAAFLVLFGGLTFGLRALSEQLVPTYVHVITWLHEPVRWLFALLTGYLTVAVLLTALHTAPIPQEYLGFRGENKNFFGLGTDRQWLGFTQYVSERPLSAGPGRIFDGAYIEVGGKPGYANKIWASFPIRYSARRGQLNGAAIASAPAATIPKPAGATPSSAGGGGGSSTPANLGF